MPPEIIGWAASAVLLATLIRQIATQVRDGSAQGVSHWLFVGQITASVGFVTYSALVADRVFIVTNACILVTAIVGQVLTSRRRRAAACEQRVECEASRADRR